MSDLPEAAEPAPVDAPRPEEEKWPVLFMLTVAMAALYVGYRIVQMVWWGIERLF